MAYLLLRGCLPFRIGPVPLTTAYFGSRNTGRDQSDLPPFDAEGVRLLESDVPVDGDEFDHKRESDTDKSAGSICTLSADG
jgi:hypothetical protein